MPEIGGWKRRSVWRQGIRRRPGSGFAALSDPADVTGVQ
jgi:hypothetical protein